MRTQRTRELQPAILATTCQRLILAPGRAYVPGEITVIWSDLEFPTMNACSMLLQLFYFVCTHFTQTTMHRCILHRPPLVKRVIETRMLKDRIMRKLVFCSIWSLYLTHSQVSLSLAEEFCRSVLPASVLRAPRKYHDSGSERFLRRPRSCRRSACVSPRPPSPTVSAALMLSLSCSGGVLLRTF